MNTLIRHHVTNVQQLTFKPLKRGHMVSMNTTVDNSLMDNFRARLSIVTTLSVIVCFAAVANTFTVVIFWRRQRRYKHFLLINMAVAETVFPLLTYWMVITSTYYGEWNYGMIGCKLYALSNAFFGLATIFTLTVMAIERKISLCHSLELGTTFRRKKVLVLGAIWLVAFLLSIPPILGWGGYVQDTYMAACIFDFYTPSANAKSYLVCLLLLGYVLPCSLIFSSYISIYRRIRQCRSVVKKIVTRHQAELETFCSSLMDSSDNRQNVDSQEAVELYSQPIANVSVLRRLAKEEVKFAKVTLAVIIGFLACWTPFALMATAYQFDSNTFHNPIASAITLLLAKSSVAINPVIYAFGEKHFRKRMIRLITVPIDYATSYLREMVMLSGSVAGFQEQR